MDRRESEAQNERMRAWFRMQTGLPVGALLSEHMTALENELNAARFPSSVPVDGETRKQSGWGIVDKHGVCHHFHKDEPSQAFKDGCGGPDERRVVPVTVLLDAAIQAPPLPPKPPASLGALAPAAESSEDVGPTHGRLPAVLEVEDVASYLAVGSRRWTCQRLQQEIERVLEPMAREISKHEHGAAASAAESPEGGWIEAAAREVYAALVVEWARPPSSTDKDEIAAITTALAKHAPSPGKEENERKPR